MIISPNTGSITWNLENDRRQN